MKLIKKESNYYLSIEENESNSRNFIASTDGMYVEHKLSKENCDELFGVVDVDNLAEENTEEFIEVFDYNDGRGNICRFNNSHQVQESYIKGFNKAMELTKDKLFTVEDIMKAFEAGYETLESEKTYNEHYDILIQSLQQPKEIEVEIKMICPHPSDTYRCGLEFGCDEDGCNNPIQIPFTDSNGCIFIRKKYYEK
jgi:hypothetical protein